MTNGEGGQPLIPRFLDALFDAYGQVLSGRRTDDGRDNHRFARR